MVTVDEVISFIENDFADIKKQLPWDFSGRQVYLGDKAVSKICFALDPLISALRQAHDWGCELLITHHPLFFTPLRGLYAGRDDAVIYAVKNEITVLSYHTNLDIAMNGVNAYLLELLGARFVSCLEKEGRESLYKLVVFIPEGYESAVLDAVSAAGAGSMGNYSRCAFLSSGTGTFTPNGAANPFIGEAGRAEDVKEIRLETVVLAKFLPAVVKAMKSVHPYEVPAFDITPVETGSEFGMGMIGELETELCFAEFINLIKTELNIADVRINMVPNHKIRRFSVCAGSGAELWRKAAELGTDILITGDMKHHTAVDARESGFSIVDTGHFHSERIYMSRFAEVLRKRFGVEVFAAEEKPPITAYI
jgi:dinuclear metal center YbgI/SA1388 family protein